MAKKPANKTKAITQAEPAAFHKIRHPKKRAMLVAYAACGHISQAAAAAGIDRPNHPLWIRKDPDYAAAFQEAHTGAVIVLEDEAHRRAVSGVQRVKFHEGRPIMGKGPDGKPMTYVEHEYSDTLLIFLLKANAPEKYRERMEVTSHQPTVIQFIGLSQAETKGLKNILPPGVGQVVAG